MADIVERMRDVPADLCWIEPTGAHRNLPIGKNSHDAAGEIERLRGLLQDALLQLEYLETKYPTGTGAWMIAHLTHALSQTSQLGQDNA